VTGRYYGYLVDPGPYVSFPPSASFTPTCTDLACDLDGSASSDPDGGAIADYSWDFGDGTLVSGPSATVSHTYAAAGTYTAKLTVTDPDGATGSQVQSIQVPPPPPPAMSLSASGYTVKGQEYVDLSWSGATTARVDLYRNGTRLRTVDNTGSWKDSLKRKTGTYTYRVCEAGSTTQCTNDSTAVF
jgi:PKD repeat protein